MKKMCALLFVIIMSALVLTGCDENEISNDDSLKEAENESVNLSAVEDSNADETEIESLSDEANELDANNTEIKDAEEAEVPVEDSPIIPLDTIMFAQQDINVRSGPGVDYEKIGTLCINDEVVVTGQDMDSGWYQIEYEEMVAFVSDEYLGENKVIISTPTNNADSSDDENVVTPPSTVNGNQNTSTDSNSSSDDLFTGDDISNALQWHQQFQP